MGEQTRTGGAKAKISETSADQLLRGRKTGEKMPLTLRTLTGLFCAGMVTGLLVKSLMPGAMGASGADGAQMGSDLVSGISAAKNGLQRNFGERRTGGWTISFAPSGTVTGVERR